MTKITLVYTGIGVAGFNAHRVLGDREGSWIGHGVASIGACLKKGGYEVNLIDMRQLSGWEEFVEKVRGSESKVWMLSVSPVDQLFAKGCAEIIKALHPESVIMVGGINPTIFPEEYMTPSIDVVVMGEGEITSVELVKMWERGEKLPKAIRGEKPDLDSIPWVDRGLFNYEMELHCQYTPDQAVPSITMISGRGCPFRCNYCQPAERSVFGLPYRMRSVENVIGEMVDLYKRYRYKSVTFWDDTFTVNKKWVMEFCYQYERSGIGATIAVCSRAGIICKNPDMVKRMAEVGFDWFVIGFESGSQRILDLIEKGTTVEQNVMAGEICKKYGVKMFATYMLGLPSETPDEALATVKMIDKINPEHKSPFYFLPIKGTGIYDICEKMGVLIPEQKEATITRTGVYSRNIKGVDYNYLDYLMQGGRERKDNASKGN